MSTVMMKKKTLWIRMMKNLKMKKLMSKAIPTLCIKILCTIIVRDSTVKHLHGNLLQIKLALITKFLRSHCLYYSNEI